MDVVKKKADDRMNAAEILPVSKPVHVRGPIEGENAAHIS